MSLSCMFLQLIFGFENLFAQMAFETIMTNIWCVLNISIVFLEIHHILIRRFRLKCCSMTSRMFCNHTIFTDLMIWISFDSNDSNISFTLFIFVNLVCAFIMILKTINFWFLNLQGVIFNVGHLLRIVIYSTNQVPYWQLHATSIKQANFFLLHFRNRILNFTVQQAGVAAPKKIREPPDMSLLHYFLNDQLSLSDSVLSWSLT